MRLFLIAILAAAAVPAVAADQPSQLAGDPLMGCWLERRFVDSASPGWTSICFSGDGVGTYADFEGGHGAEASFRYEARDDELRQWDPDTPQQARTCAFSISGSSVTVKGCGLRGIYQLKCRDIRVSDGSVSCPPAAK